MSGTSHSSPQAVREALAALERYQLHLRQLATRWADAELYHTLSLDLQEVRRCCHLLPTLTGEWVALLIAHAELSQALWRGAPPQPAAVQAERQRLLGRAGECVRALQHRCMDLADGGTGGPH